MVGVGAGSGSDLGVGVALGDGLGEGVAAGVGVGVGVSCVFQPLLNGPLEPKGFNAIPMQIGIIRIAKVMMRIRFMLCLPNRVIVGYTRLSASCAD